MGCQKVHWWTELHIYIQIVTQHVISNMLTGVSSLSLSGWGWNFWSVSVLAKKVMLVLKRGGAFTASANQESAECSGLEVLWLRRSGVLVAMAAAFVVVMAACAQRSPPSPRDRCTGRIRRERAAAAWTAPGWREPRPAAAGPSSAGRSPAAASWSTPGVRGHTPEYAHPGSGVVGHHANVSRYF